MDSFNTIFEARYWDAVPFHFWSLVFFTFGCFVGSFLNVCIHRMPLGISIISPPSHCPHCKHSIPWYLNVPLVTWLWLRGKCRNCGAPISIRYILVELLTGLAFLACWLSFGNPAHQYASMPLALVYCVFLAGLIVATFIDFEHFIIPDEITLGGCVVGFLCSLLIPSLHDMPGYQASLTDSLKQSLFGIGMGTVLVYAIVRAGKLLFGRERVRLTSEIRVVFSEFELHLAGKDYPYGELLHRRSDTISMHAKEAELVDRCYRNVPIRLTRERLHIGNEELNPEEVHHMEVVCDEIVLPREAMGLGDVKFMAAIGAFLGWQAVVFSLMVSSIIGAVVGVTLIVAGKREWSSRLPYGPYIALAAAIWIFAGRQYFALAFR